MKLQPIVVPMTLNSWCFFFWFQISAYKLKPFYGTRVCFFGFPEEEKKHMYEVLQQQGGEPTEFDDPNCTHVVSRWFINEHSSRKCLSQLRQTFWLAKMSLCAWRPLPILKQQQTISNALFSAAVLSRRMIQWGNRPDKNQILMRFFKVDNSYDKLINRFILLKLLLFSFWNSWNNNINSIGQYFEWTNIFLLLYKVLFIEQNV